MIRAGELRERIRLEHLVATSWTPLDFVWAAVSPGGFVASPPSLDPELPSPAPGTPYQVRIRYRTDVTNALRIRCGARTLSIDSIVDPDSRRRELLIQCAEFVSFADRHAYALAAIAREGTAITFSKSRGSTNYDSPTDTIASPSTPVTVSGYAKRIAGEPQANRSETLVEIEAPELLFVPSTYGQLPAQTATCVLAGVTFSVRFVNAIAPDGVAIAARVVIER